jgi:hypothetical protein
MNRHSTINQSNLEDKLVAQCNDGSTSVGHGFGLLGLIPASVYGENDKYFGSGGLATQCALLTEQCAAFSTLSFHLMQSFRSGPPKRTFEQMNNPNRSLVFKIAEAHSGQQDLSDSCASMSHRPHTAKQAATTIGGMESAKTAVTADAAKASATELSEGQPEWDDGAASIPDPTALLDTAELWTCSADLCFLDGPGTPATWS